MIINTYDFLYSALILSTIRCTYNKPSFNKFQWAVFKLSTRKNLSISQEIAILACKSGNNLKEGIWYTAYVTVRHKLQLTSQCDISGVMVGNYRHRYLCHSRVLIWERSFRKIKAGLVSGAYVKGLKGELFCNVRETGFKGTGVRELMPRVLVINLMMRGYRFYLFMGKNNCIKWI